MLSDEQTSKTWPFSLLNDEQMSNWVGVKHLPVFENHHKVSHHPRYPDPSKGWRHSGDQLPKNRFIHPSIAGFQLILRAIENMLKGICSIHLPPNLSVENPNYSEIHACIRVFDRQSSINTLVFQNPQVIPCQ